MKLSFIICTRNRAAALSGCLDSVTAALLNAMLVDAEIVVVDNASDDGTSAIVRKWAETCPFPVNLQYEARKGLAAARNCGIRAAKGELIAFTDDDCRLDKDYVKALLRHDAADTEPVLRGGRIELGDPTDLPLTIKTSAVVERRNKQMRSARSECLCGAISGCNMALRRTVLERLGPFDEFFGPGAPISGGEDADYIFRAYVAGITIEYVPDMVVFHYHGRKSPADGRKLLRDYMIGTGALYAKFIFSDFDLCRQFWWDTKAAMREIISRTNTCLPDIGFSHKDKVMYCILGALKYVAARAGYGKRT